MNAISLKLRFKKKHTHNICKNNSHHECFVLGNKNKTAYQNYIFIDFYTIFALVLRYLFFTMFAFI